METNKRNKNLRLVIALSLGMLASCEFDNFDAPQADLTGRVVYDSNPVSVRSNGVELEIWQRGYELFQKVPLHVAPDGSFSAKLFDGDYQITQRNNNGPWLNSSDTVHVSVRGNTIIDFEVTPFFTLGSVEYAQTGDEITATFTASKVAESASMELVGFYLGTTFHTDRVRREHAVEQSSDVSVEGNRQFTLTATIPQELRGRQQIYVRIGLKNAGVEELLYSAPFPLSLQ